MEEEMHRVRQSESKEMKIPFSTDDNSYKLNGFVLFIIIIIVHIHIDVAIKCIGSLNQLNADGISTKNPIKQLLCKPKNSIELCSFH